MVESVIGYYVEVFFARLYVYICKAHGKINAYKEPYNLVYQLVVGIFENQLTYKAKRDLFAMQVSVSAFNSEKPECIP